MGQKFWFKLDNAAKLYPAIANSRWMSMFRLSVEMEDMIDPALLQQAVDRVMPRFPTMNVQLRAGLFWYYLEEVSRQLPVRQDSGHPCMPFSKEKDGRFLIRVFYYRHRISVEFFHVLTDASGGMAFLKTLTVQYLRLKGQNVQFDHGALNIDDTPSKEETTDAFQTIPLPRVRISRTVDKAYHFPATRELPHTLNVISASMPADLLLQKAREMKVSLTEYLVSLILQAADQCQRREGKRTMRPIRVSVPVNLRPYYKTSTLRNFSSFVNPFIDPRLGEYSFEEICRCVHNFMAYHCTQKQLSAAVSTNVSDEKYLFIRLVPLFIKNMVISSVFRRSGDLHFTSTFSNLGKTEMPTGSEAHIRRFEFLLGVPYAPVCNCACVTTGNDMRLTFSGNIRETTLPRALLCRLVETGIPVEVESNCQED